LLYFVLEIEKSPIHPPSWSIDPYTFAPKNAKMIIGRSSAIKGKVRGIQLQRFGGKYVDQGGGRASTKNEGGRET